MATRKKQVTIKPTRFIIDLIIAFAILLILLLLLQLDFIAEPVAKVFGTTPDKVKAIAQAAVPFVAGMLLIYWGVVALSVPVVGVVVILAGVSLLGYASYLWFSDQDDGQSLQSLGR